MVRTSLAIAAVCGTVQIASGTGEDGCCFHNNDGGYSIQVAYALQLDESFGLIPQGAQCDAEWGGLEGMTYKGDTSQEMDTQCVWEDGSRVRYFSWLYKFANGTTFHYTKSLWYDNYTQIDEACVRTQSSETQPEIGSIQNIAEKCYGGKYHHGSFMDYKYYGSVKALMFGFNNYPSLNNWIHIDVDNGCIPIRQSPPAMTFTYFIPYSMADIRLPKKCREASITNATSQKVHHMSLLSKNTMGTPSVV